MANDTIDLHPAMPMGMLKKQLADRGITDVKLVAESMERLKQL